MNINDVASPEHIPDPRDIAYEIYKRQLELEERYHLIEVRPLIIDLNSQHGQVIAKDFLWRITEEIGEALETWFSGGGAEKIREEFADAMHFVAGLGVITSNLVAFQEGFVRDYPYGDRGHVSLATLIKDLGVLGNCLKWKPWKQTPILTDVPVFNECYIRMVSSFLGYAYFFGIDRHKMYDLYYRKSEVNLFRIRSKY